MCRKTLTSCFGFLISKIGTVLTVLLIYWVALRTKLVSNTEPLEWGQTYSSTLQMLA